MGYIVGVLVALFIAFLIGKCRYDNGEAIPVFTMLFVSVVCLLGNWLASFLFLVVLIHDIIFYSLYSMQSDWADEDEIVEKMYGGWVLFNPEAGNPKKEDD